jgi:membrane fusion protein (multidrug efflux system)
MKSNIYLLLTTVTMFAACSGNNKPVDLTTKSTKANQYQFGRVMEKALSNSAQLPGQLIPFNEVNLFPKVNGFVKELYVDRGSMVKKGQLLVVLEAPEMESQLQAANSQYIQAKEDALASKEKFTRLISFRP